MTLTEERILGHRAFWRLRPYEKKDTEKGPNKRKTSLRWKPPVKGAKKRALEHYCGGKPRCFWPGGCTVTELAMLQLHHINGDGKGHKERLRLVAGNYYVALELEGYPEGLKPLCANHHIMMHTKNGAYWNEYLF